MRKTAIYLAAITLTCFTASLCSAEISWESKLRSAHAKAKKERKLMLLHFYSDNCVWCDRLEAGAFQSNSVAQAVDQGFVPVKIHGGKNPKLAKMFKVSKYPTDVIVTTDGKALSHSVSPQAPDRYIAMLGQARANFATGTTMLADKGTATKPSAPKQAVTNQAAPNQAATRQQVASAPPAYARQETPTQPPTTRPAPTQQIAQAPAGFGMPKGATPPAPTSTTMPVQIPSPGMVASNQPSPASPTASTSGTTRGNQFVLPSASSGGVEASLTGARTDGMSLSAATLSAAAPPTKNTPNANKPELAMQGYCPVSVIQDNEWVEGNPELGVIHLGKLYLFASEPAMETFLADPIPFTPMLNGIDVVRFFEEKKIVQGRREWGVVDQVHNRMFFFADEAAMNHFTETFENYLEPAMEVMDVAVKAANPGA